jgi:thioredoxin 1
MTRNIPLNARWLRLFSWVVIIIFVFGIASCGDNTTNKTRDPLADSGIRYIDSMEQFNNIIQTSGERLLMFEFYADWCPPCKEIEPVLEKIAKEKSAMVTVYKINIDRNKALATSFRVGGVPHVVYFKNKETVLTLSGLYPKNMYLKLVERFSAAVEL